MEGTSTLLRDRNKLNLPKVLNHNEEKREDEWNRDNLINTHIILWI